MTDDENPRSMIDYVISMRKELDRLRKERSQLLAALDLQSVVCLSPSQIETLEAIAAHVEKHGSAPTYRELAAALNIGTTTAHDRVFALAGRGVVCTIPAQQGIRLTRKGLLHIRKNRTLHG